MKKTLVNLQSTGTVLLSGGNAFTTREFFIEGGKNGVNNFRFLYGFKTKILNTVSDVINPITATLEKYNITKDMFNNDILLELGNPPLFSVDSCLGCIQELIRKRGDLSTNGYCNIFYVQLHDRVVVVNIFSQSGCWFLDCDEFEGNENVGWHGGQQIFSLPTTIQAV